MPMTTKKGESTSPERSHEGHTAKLAGKIEFVWSGPGPEEPLSISLPAPGTDNPPTSTILRMAMINRMIQS